MSINKRALSYAFYSLFFIGLVNGGQVFAAPKNQNPDTSIEPIPNWQITIEGTADSVTWADHAPNPRFAIYDNGSPDNDSDDLVLDKETGLVWVRDLFNLPAGYSNPNRSWIDAIYTSTGFGMGNRRGWRIPSIGEFLSLIDTNQQSPALPIGHPFINVESGASFWSSTSAQGDNTKAWGVAIDNGGAVIYDKSAGLKSWPVRGD